MTLILGLKSNDCVVIGAEQEEAGGVASKRLVTKLKLITGPDWAVVVGGAGDSAVAENAMLAMDKRLRKQPAVNGQVLMDVTEEILDRVHTRYIDKDAKSEGMSLVIGASCGDGLHLISTAKRVPQLQDEMAYAGIGADIAIYLMDRLHRKDDDWIDTVNEAAFTIQQVSESCIYCSGESEIYVLQGHPDPRWRYLGKDDAPVDFMSCFQGATVSQKLRELIAKERHDHSRFVGYRDEHRPKPRTQQEVDEEIQENFRAWEEEKKKEGN